MIGRRVEWTAQLFNPGEYSKLPDGTWYAESPNGHTANLSAHTVTEHDDGTITVSPSIGIGNKQDANGNLINNLYHGFLERGVWRDC